ncbi:hypothetical protein C8T65DRAFT_14752 [Cerioporus squamosus]|nr:hypothetical protein C8T65DRAFT_14752 [Cerioporus squamosus]
MFTPTVVYPRETQNITVVDDADIPWPVRPIDFPALDAEIVPYLNEAFQGEVFDQTLTAITLPLKFSYTFTGTHRVVLFGVAFPRLSGNAVTANYTLDDRPPITLQPANVLDTTNVVLFSADDLASGSHTLTVEVDAGPSYPYVVDYLQFELLDVDPAAPSLSSAASSTSTISPVLPSSPQSSTIASGGTTAPNAGTSDNNVRAIVGGIIGGLALLCIMVVAVLWYRHHPRSQESTRKASIFSAESMVQPRTPPLPLPVHMEVPAKPHHCRIEKLSRMSRPTTVMTASDSDTKFTTQPSSAATSPVSERPPTIRLEPPPRIAYPGDRYVRSSREAYELFGSPPAYTLSG